MTKRVTRRGLRAADELFWHLVSIQTEGNKAPITYTDATNCMTVPNVLTRSMGRILDTVKEICKQNDLPDLACMVVRKTTREPGHRYKFENPRWVATQQKVLTYDWTDLIDYSFTCTLIAPKLKK